jgi:hypothetical protein
MIANASRRTAAVSRRITAYDIGRERYRDHGLAESPVLECRAGASATNLFAAPGQFGG